VEAVVRIRRVTPVALVVFSLAACTPKRPALRISVDPSPIPTYVVYPGHGFCGLGASWTVTITEAAGSPAWIESVRTTIRDSATGQRYGDVSSNQADLARQLGTLELPARGRLSVDQAVVVPITEAGMRLGPDPGPLRFSLVVRAHDEAGGALEAHLEVAESNPRPAACP
jgi:hypothetical protein